MHYDKIRVETIVQWFKHEANSSLPRRHGRRRRFVVQRVLDGLPVLIQRPEVIPEQILRVIPALQRSEAIPVLAITGHRALRRLMSTEELPTRFEIALTDMLR